MEIIEALEIKGRPYRYRATIRWGPRSSSAVPLCKCRQGHSSKREALDCPKARAEMPAEYKDMIIEPEED